MDIPTGQILPGIINDLAVWRLRYKAPLRCYGKRVTIIAFSRLTKVTVVCKVYPLFLSEVGKISVTFKVTSVRNITYLENILDITCS